MNDILNNVIQDIEANLEVEGNDKDFWAMVNGIDSNLEKQQEERANNTLNDMKEGL